MGTLYQMFLTGTEVELLYTHQLNGIPKGLVMSMCRSPIYIELYFVRKKIHFYVKRRTIAKIMGCET